MMIVYKIGVVVGIIVMYLAATIFIGLIASINDREFFMIAAYINGLALFVILAIFTLEKFGLWW